MTRNTKDQIDSSGRPTASVQWCSAEALLTDIHHVLLPCGVLLDVGCGIKPQRYVRPIVHICCDPFQQYVEKLQEIIATEKDRIYVVVKATWDEAVRMFPPNSVDTVFLLDVVEHLEKEEGKRLLAQTERIARRQIVVFTPLGFMPQYHKDGKDAWGLDGADLQEHKSGWVPEDFGDGWQIIAAKEFHMADNLSRPLENPFGAFWAIKTHPSVENGEVLTREHILRNIEAEFSQKQTVLGQKEAVLHQKEMEINSLIFARIERKIRRTLRKFSANKR